MAYSIAQSILDKMPIGGGELQISTFDGIWRIKRTGDNEYAARLKRPGEAWEEDQIYTADELVGRMTTRRPVKA